MKLFTCLATTDLNKLPLVNKVLLSQKDLCDEVHVAIITNKTDLSEINLIKEHIPEQSKNLYIEIVNRGYENLPSPWLLTWMHKELMYEKFQDTSYTHFMCIEDDMLVTKKNFDYWIEYKEKLKPHQIIPSFLRVELNSERWMALDLVKGDKFNLDQLPKLQLNNITFVNIWRVYQGMFLYDRELMQEHINSKKYKLVECVPDWNIRILNTSWPLGLTEAAVLGLTHVNVPDGCFSRNFLPLKISENIVDESCFVHHLPNKYTNDLQSDFGTIPVSEIFAT
jgi:hypothetical protein